MIAPSKPTAHIHAPAPPPRIESARDRLRKPALELPILQTLTSRRSERDHEGTPHNKEVNSTLLAKVDRFGENDLMTRKYRLYLQKRKKKCAGGSRDLMALINKFETLDLKNASCFAMCSQEEIVRRQAQGDFDLMERVDIPGEKKMRPDYAIKKFTRSSADQHLDKADILRPPFILSKTMEHIMTRLLDDDSKEVSQFPPPVDGRPRADYLDIYLFVSDRLRSIKQDIQILSSHCPEIFSSKIVIQIYEQIVRFYILSCNELLDREGFDPKINLEQLSSAFTSLMQCYKLSRQSLAAMYLKFKGPTEAMADMVEEVIYVSPSEAEFMSLNLLMLYFEKEASFQTALQSIEKDHPEVLDSKPLDEVLRVVSMLSKRNYAQYLRAMSETKDLLLGHVMGLPEFVNTVRIKYFYVLKTLEFGPGRGSMELEGRSAPLDEYQRRLHIDTLDEMKYFLTFMHGKKNKGFELFNVEKNVINLEHYQADIADLLSKISKIKMNRPIQSLKASLAACSPTNKREVSVKGPKKENSAFVKLVHQHIYAAIRKTGGESLTILEEPLSEDQVSVEEPTVPEVSKTLIQTLKPETSLSKKIPEIDIGEPKVNKLARKKKGAELSLQLLKKKVRTTRREVFRLWSMYSIAKSAEQLEKLREYLDSKNEQTRFECFDQWRLQVYKRRALLEEIMEIPDFEGNFQDVEYEEFSGLQYLPFYNYYQTFIMLLFNHLLRKWFEYLTPQQILSQNLSAVRHFKLSWLFVVDRNSPEAEYLAPFLGLFLLTPEESLATILEGKTVECEYFVDNWIDREGTVHHGRSTLQVSLQCRSPNDIGREQVVNADFLVVFGTDRSIDRQLGRWCHDLQTATDDKYDTAKHAYFATFADLMRDCKKEILRIEPHPEYGTATFWSESLDIEDVAWCYFNYELNHASTQAFLSICLKRLSSMTDWIDETFFSGQFLNLKIMDQSKIFGVEGLLRSLLNSLGELQQQRVQILTNEDLFLDLDSQRFIQKLMQKNFEGFFFVRNLVAVVIQEMVSQAQVQAKDSAASVIMLQNLHKAIMSDSLNNDVFLVSPRNLIFYNYVVNILTQCSQEWRSLFPMDINYLIWDKLVGPINYNPIDHFSADWLQFFIYLLDCIVECLKLTNGKPHLRLIKDFEVRMLIDIRFPELFATACTDFKKFTMRQYWTPDRLQKFNQDIARHNEDNFIQQSMLLHEDLTQQTDTPSVSDLEEESIGLGKRTSCVEFSYNSLHHQFITRLLKL